MVSLERRYQTEKEGGSGYAKTIEKRKRKRKRRLVPEKKKRKTRRKKRKRRRERMEGNQLVHWRSSRRAPRPRHPAF